MTWITYAPPKIDWTKPIEGCIEDAEAVVKWARNNLPEINRARDVAMHFGLTKEQEMTLALALEIREKCYCFNILIEQEMLKPPKPVPIV